MSQWEFKKLASSNLWDASVLKNILMGLKIISLLLLIVSAKTRYNSVVAWIAECFKWKCWRYECSHMLQCYYDSTQCTFKATNNFTASNCQGWIYRFKNS